MQALTLDDIIEELRQALERNDVETALNLLNNLRTPDQADVVEELDERQRAELLERIAPAEVADIVEELEDRDAAQYIASLPPDKAIRILEEMEPDEAADLLGDLEPHQALELISGLQDPEEVRPLLLHPDDSAGGLMTSEFLALRRRMTAAQAIEAIRAWQPEDEAVYYLFVVDGQGRLVGVVSLRQLIVADPNTPLSEIMDPDVISVQAGADQEEVARLMTRYDLLALPVVDDNKTLLGVITVDDVMEVIEEEATEDIQRLGGAQPLEEPYLRTGVLSIARKRIGWLLLLFVTGSLTGTVMRIFERQLEAAVSLTVFVPLLIGTGGNAGSQTTATIIRALAVGDIDLHDALRSWWHEMRVGLLLGLGMGAIAYLRAVTWGYDPSFGLTIALAIFTIVIWANGLGSILPLLAARLGVDPTVVSGPLMSTLVDATGLFIYFSIAKLVLGL
jgi:magnesium transporter